MKASFTYLFGTALLIAMSRPSFASSAIDSPPAGIVPTTTTLGQVLRAHDAAAGALTDKSDLTRIEVWQFTKAGAQGSERLIRHGTDYHSIIKTGPFTEEYGQLGDARWYMDQNAVVTDTTDVENSSFEMFRVIEEVTDPKNDVKLLGETQNTQPAYVVEVRTHTATHPLWIFFDKKSALIVRTEFASHSKRFISTFDDYQTTRGLTEPTHIHDTDGTPALDDDYRRESVEFSSSIGPNEYGRPQTKMSYMHIDRHVNLRARVIDGNVVIRLNINGRGLDFELSSGDAESLIDWDVAQELKLPTFGQVTQAEGTSQDYETVIEDATAGDVPLHHFAVRALPFHYRPDFSTKVVGVLGYDFLSQALFTVDYVHGNVTGEPISDVPLSSPNGYTIPIWIDGGRPFFTAFIGSHETNDVLLDSSFDFSFVLGSFSQAYPESVADLWGKRHSHTVVPFADHASYGQDADIWLAQVKQLQVGTMNFADYHMFATNWDLEQGDHPVDAIVGSTFLQYFDVSYDFAHGRVLLKPNDWFRRYFRVS